ncbi:hypothetical protein [Streptomyces sp. NPDC048590]|uniref:hypothetical protein n=1 Tax=Streptomyces sp. NPDC048590 TaxID=3365574 RepID=UPI003711818A
MEPKRSTGTSGATVCVLAAPLTTTAQAAGDGDCTDAGNIYAGYGGTSHFDGSNVTYLTFYDDKNEFSSFRKTGC